MALSPITGSPCLDSELQLLALCWGTRGLGWGEGGGGNQNACGGIY